MQKIGVILEDNALGLPQFTHTLVSISIPFRDVLKSQFVKSIRRQFSAGIIGSPYLISGSDKSNLEHKFFFFN